MCPLLLKSLISLIKLKRPKRLTWLAGLLCLMACDGRSPIRESPLPDSQKGATLEHFQPPEALDRIGEWYPHDWRLHLFRGLTDSSWQGKVRSLRRADSLHPGESLIAYQLCLAYLERDDSGGTELARPWLDKAMAVDSGNGVLLVIDAYLLVKEGKLGRARSLFLDPRRVPTGDFKYARLEEALLGLFSDCRHLNPYTLTEAVELYRRVPFPPFERLIDILYSVYLSPLPEHPYDIRMRGRDAAMGLFRLGRTLRTRSYSGPKVLSDGYEQCSLGFLFQLKAGEFLTLHYRAFEDTAGSAEAFAEVVRVQQEYQAFMASQPWLDPAVAAYLDGWADLIAKHPGMKVSEAAATARGWRLWNRAMSVRVPKSDG